MFRTLEVSLELVRSLREVVRRLGTVDRDLAAQIRRAASSASLNLAEGNGRSGKDRHYSFRVARGSVLEVQAGLRLAVAWGYLDEVHLERPLALTSDLLGMLTGLLR